MRKLYYELRKWALVKAAFLLSPFIRARMARRKALRDPHASLRILVIPNLTRIGDLVCATPVFRAIKIAYPNCYLAVMVQGKISGIIRNNPRIDEIIEFKSKDLVKRVIPLVRSKKFDWSINLQGYPISSLVTFFGLIPNRVALTYDGASFLVRLTQKFNTIRMRYEHHTYLPGFYLKLLEPLGIKNPEEKKEVFPTQAGDEKVKKFFSDKGIATSDKVVGISITAGNKIKEWGDENFRKVGEYVVEKYGAKVIFLGAKNDESRIDAVIASCHSRLFPRHSRESGNLTRNFVKAVDFSLEELPSLIKRLKLYIAADTGPIYIAHALKVPLIDIIGPVDPREQPPKDERSVQVLSEGTKPSSFVLSQVCHSRASGNPYERALTAIPFEKVAHAVDKLLVMR
jgi:ADP-heptose:LPS heptosyltransferase